jgi:hypothetical protein
MAFSPNPGGMYSGTQSKGMGQKQQAIEYLLNMYNNDPDQFTKKQQQQIASLAYQSGLPFDVESKPLRKGLFDLADMAALGFIPNKWRPRSVGQEYFGETGIDKFAGGVGTIAGLAPAFMYSGPAALRGLVAGSRGAMKYAGAGKKGFDVWRAGSGAGIMPKAGASVWETAGNAGAKVTEAIARMRADLMKSFYQGYGKPLSSGQLNLF